MRVGKIKPLVHDALIKNPAARADDFILIYEVLKHYVTEKMPLETVLKEHIALGVPSFASIIRIRRKLQEQDPSLEPSESVKDIRAAEEQQYRDWAKNDKWKSIIVFFINAT